MKLSHTLLFAAAAWMESGHAHPCDDLRKEVVACLGEGEMDCEACIKPDPAEMEAIDGEPKIAEEILRDALMKCTEEGQPCAQCAAELEILTECTMADHNYVPGVPEPPIHAENE